MVTLESKANDEMLDVLQAIDKYWKENPNAPLYARAQLFETEIEIHELVDFVVSHVKWLRKSKS